MEDLIRLTLRIVLIAAASVAVCPGPMQTPKVLDLCTVASNIYAYSGQYVRVTAFFVGGAEQSVLYDPKCQDGKAMIAVSFGAKVSGRVATLHRLVKRKRHAPVTVEGTMHGGEPMQVDPRLPDWLKDRFKGSSQRYGHLNSFEMMIEVTRVLSVKDEDDGLAAKVGIAPSPK